MPQSTAEWERQQEILDAQEARTEKAKAESAQTQTAVDSALSAAIGLPLPEFDGVIGEYVGAATDAASDPAMEVIKKLWSAGRRHAETIKLELGPRPVHQAVE